MATKIIEFSAK